MNGNETRSLRRLGAAPHRLLFFGGTLALVLAMLWWGLWLLIPAAVPGTMSRMPPGMFPVPASPPGWVHATVLQYQVLPLFVFGFLVTGMPRWLDAPAFRAAHYLPVAVALVAGVTCSLLGLVASAALFVPGLMLTLVGWLIGLGLLVALFLRSARLDWHAVSVLVALCLGVLGLLAWLWWERSGDWRFAYLSMKVGTFGLLLPVFFTVTHRVLPFFAGNALKHYTVYKPVWCLAAFWVLALAHLVLELAHAYAWLWLVDLPLALLCAWLWLRWQPWRAWGNRLLAVLFVAWAWLPTAFAFFALQSAWLYLGGVFLLPRAPLHALVVGGFAGLVVAMVTRVSLGHSGRTLVMGNLAWWAFWGVQAAAVTRLAAEWASDPGPWLIASAWIWVLALTPWALQCAGMYIAPRVDQRAG